MGGGEERDGYPFLLFECFKKLSSGGWGDIYPSHLNNFKKKNYYWKEMKSRHHIN